MYCILYIYILFRFSYIFLPSFPCVIYTSLSSYNGVSEYISGIS